MAQSASNPREAIGVRQFWVDGHIPSKSNSRYTKSADAAARRNYIKSFQQTVGMLALRAGCSKMPQDAEVAVFLTGYGQDTDPDNWWKALLDGLEGVAFANDRQVTQGGWRSIARPDSEGKHGVMVSIHWFNR